MCETIETKFVYFSFFWRGGGGQKLPLATPYMLLLFYQLQQKGN